MKKMDVHIVIKNAQCCIPLMTNQQRQRKIAKSGTNAVFRNDPVEDQSWKTHKGHVVCIWKLVTNNKTNINCFLRKTLDSRVDVKYDTCEMQTMDSFPRYSHLSTKRIKIQNKRKQHVLGHMYTVTVLIFPLILLPNL